MTAPLAEFFLPCIPPTVTAQEKGVSTRKDGKPFVYTKLEIKAARAEFLSLLVPHAPPAPFRGPVRLVTKWLFPLKGKHGDGEWKTSKPDGTNAAKLFEDAMTDAGFWRDDAEVSSSVTEKFWAANPGIYVRVEQLFQPGAKQS